MKVNAIIYEISLTLKKTTIYQITKRSDNSNSLKNMAGSTIKKFIFTILILSIRCETTTGNTKLPTQGIPICGGDCTWVQYLIVALGVIFFCCCCGCVAAARDRNEILRDERD